LPAEAFKIFGKAIQGIFPSIKGHQGKCKNYPRAPKKLTNNYMAAKPICPNLICGKRFSEKGSPTRHISIQ
jgi:hypothetical protein